MLMFRWCYRVTLMLYIYLYIYLLYFYSFIYVINLYIYICRYFEKKKYRIFKDRKTEYLILGQTMRPNMNKCSR